MHLDDIEQLKRNGAYFLKRDRNKARTIGIYTVKPVTSASGRTENQTVRVAPTDTSDPVIAEIALDRFCLNNKEALQKERVRQAKGETESKAIERPVLEAMNFYFLGHAEKKAETGVDRLTRNTMISIGGAWPENPLCSALDRDMQKRFVAYMRAEGFADNTISSRLTLIWTAMHWCDSSKLLARTYPKKINPMEWEANLTSDEDDGYTLDELARLFVAAREVPAYWRYMVTAVATGSRPTAILQLRRSQLDFPHRLCKLNPPGRRQTKKRRALVPMCPTFYHEAQSWQRVETGPRRGGGGYAPDEGHVVGMRSTRFYGEVISVKAAVEDSYPMRIRHTVRTWLAEQGVSDAKADIFVGHAEEGSATGRRFYKHLKPGYLSECAEAVEKLFMEIERRSGIPFARPAAVECAGQPLVWTPLESAWAAIVTQRGNYVTSIVDKLMISRTVHEIAETNVHSHE